MGEKNNLYYYKGSSDIILNRLSLLHGMIFCKILYDKDNREYRNDLDYYDPVKKRYINKVFQTRKNLMLEYYIYNSKEKDFNKLVIKDNKIYNRRFTDNFFNTNFISVNKIKDKIDLMDRMKKIEKIKNNLN